VSWPQVIGFGAGDIRIEWTNANGAYTARVSGDATSTVINGAPISPATVDYHQKVKIYKESAQGDILLAESPDSFIYDPNIAGGSTSTARMKRSVLYFSGLRADARSLQLFLWRSGDSKPAMPISVPAAKTIAGSLIPGWFIFDWNNFAIGDYNYEFTTFDSAGNALDYAHGQLTLGRNPTVNGKFIDTVQPVFTPGAPSRTSSPVPKPTTPL